MKNRPLERQAFNGVGGTDNRTEGQTDMTNLIVAFRNFARSGTKLKKNYV